MSDTQALIARHRELFLAQPLLFHLQGAGTPAQAAHLSSHVSLVVLWLGDLFRFAEERANDPVISARLAEQSAAASARAHRFRADLQAFGLLPTSLSLYTDEHALIREVAFALAADVISTEQDCVRLGMTLSVAANCDLILKAVTAFASRASGQEAVVEPPVPNAGFEPQLTDISMSDAVASEVFAAVNRCFNSVLRVVHAIDRMTFGSSSSVADATSD